MSRSIIAAVLYAAFASGQRQSAGGPPGGDVFHVAVSRNGPATLFASALAGGVFRSVDAGASWQEVDNGLPGGAFCELVIDPRVTRVVYAVCGERIFKTIDDGGRWTPLTLPATARRDLIIAPSNSKILYLPGKSSSQLFVSRTAGRTWTVVKGPGLPDKSWQDLAVDPLDAAILYCVCGERLFRSIDAGTNWIAVTKDLPATEEIGTVRVDPRTARRGLCRRRPKVVQEHVGRRVMDGDRQVPRIDRRRSDRLAGVSWRDRGPRE